MDTEEKTVEKTDGEAELTYGGSNLVSGDSSRPFDYSMIKPWQEAMRRDGLSFVAIRLYAYLYELSEGGKRMVRFRSRATLAKKLGYGGKTPQNGLTVPWRELIRRGLIWNWSYRTIIMVEPKAAEEAMESYERAKEDRAPHEGS